MNAVQKLVVKWLGLDKALEQKALLPLNTPLRFDNGRIVAPIENKNKYITDAYSVNDVIYSVINLILNKVRLPGWKLYEVTDNPKLKQANNILARPNLSIKEYKAALKLKDDSLDEITNFNLQTGKLNDLLDYPNELETFEEQIVKSCLFKLLTGDSYTWGQLLGGGANQGIPNSLWVLPAQFMTIKIDGGFPAKPVGYEMFQWAQNFSTKEILHELYPNPNFNINGGELYGFSPLRAFTKNTTRNNSAKDASTAKFQNGGSEGVLSIDGSKLDGFSGSIAKEQAEALKLQMVTEYAGPTNLGKIVTSGYPTNFTQFGLSPVDLGIIDSEKWDAIMFCNGFNVPPELLGLTAKTFNNMIEAQKALILGAAMPLLDARRRALNRKITTDWGFKGKNVHIDYETDCFPELEADVSKTMDWMSKVTMVTPNEERISVGLDALTEPEADEVWVLQGGNRIPLTDFQANIVEQTLANGANGQTNMENGNGGNSQKPEGNGGVSNGNAKDVRLKKVI